MNKDKAEELTYFGESHGPRRALFDTSDAGSIISGLAELDVSEILDDNGSPQDDREKKQENIDERIFCSVDALPFLRKAGLSSDFFKFFKMVGGG